MKKKINEIDGKFYKKCQVVMLSCSDNSEGSDLWESKVGILTYNVGMSINPLKFIHEGYKNRHLYILSNEEIKEGDWCYTNNSMLYTKHIFKATKRDLEEDSVRKQSYKIIATTDKLLIKSIKLKGLPYKEIDYYVAKLSDGFLEKFCEVGGIWEVLVEYEQNIIQYTSKVASDGNYEGNCPICNKYAHWMGTGGNSCFDHYNLKVASDNTITIKPVQEETYTKEEVNILLKRAFGCAKSFGCYLDKEQIEGWIKENLK